MMKKLFAVAAFLLASTAAQAQYSFEYGGRTIRIDPDRGTVSIQASTITAVPGQNVRMAIRTATARANNRRPSRLRPIRRRPLQALLRPKTWLRPPTLPRSLQLPPRASRQRIPSRRHSLRPADVRFSRILPPPPSPKRRLSLQRLRRRRPLPPPPRPPRRPTRRSACG